MKISYQIILFFFGVIFISGCKTVKTSDGATLRVRSANFLVKKLDQQRLDVEWIAKR